jgi:hypothetical protein
LAERFAKTVICRVRPGNRTRPSEQNCCTSELHAAWLPFQSIVLGSKEFISSQW